MSEEVWYPYVLFLCNLPVEFNDKKVLVCSYSNEELAELLGEFAGNLKQTSERQFLTETD